MKGVFQNHMRKYKQRVKFNIVQFTDHITWCSCNLYHIFVKPLSVYQFRGKIENKALCHAHVETHPSGLKVYEEFKGILELDI